MPQSIPEQKNMQYKFGHTQDLFLRYTRMVLCAALTRLDRERERKSHRSFPSEEKNLSFEGKCVMRNDVGERERDIGFMRLRLLVQHPRWFVPVLLQSRLRDEEIWVVGLRRWLVRGA
jgi:hypothetical protein